jgi:hypothetical protein
MIAHPQITVHDRDRSGWIRDLEAEAIKLGTDNQRERYAAGLLPEDELLAIAREELFRPFAAFSRFSTAVKVRDRDVHHTRDCPRTRTIEYETTQADELSHDEWAGYRAIQAARDVAFLHPWLQAAGAGHVTTEPLMHWGSCPLCKAEAYRSSARVVVEWAARELVREYVLR